MNLTPIGIGALLIASQTVGAEDIFDDHIKNNTMAISPDEKIAVVAKSNMSELLIYNLEKGVLDQKVLDVKSPRNVLFDDSGRYILISDSTKGTVDKRDAEDLKIISSMPIGPGAFGSALSPDGNRIFVNNQAANTVTVYNVKTEVPLSVITGFEQPRQGIIFAPSGDLVYVTNFQGDKIIEVDANTYQPLREITGFNKLRAISITADGKTLYAANSGNDTLSKVDLNTARVVSTVTVGKEPYGAALRPDETILYSGNLAGNSLTVISTDTFKVVGEITGFSGPRQAIKFTKDNKYAWVLNEDLSISEVDLDKMKITRTLTATQ